MKFLRLTLLHSYFLNNRNKKKALSLINIGIFFTIFAISSAIISFFIETKISEKEEELIYLQIETLQTGKEISDIEMFMFIYESQLDNEQESRILQQFLSTTKLGSRTVSQEDFYTPYIYYSLLEIKDLITPDADLTNKDDPINKGMIELVTGVWDDEDVIKLKNSIIDFSKSYKKIEKLNLNDFKYEKIPSQDEILKEILNHSKHNLISENDKISDYHYNIILFDIAAVKYFKQMIKFLKSTHATNRDNIDEINKEIISLSKNEKNIILITFIFQLIIFVIIQFFEINSFTANFKKKTK